MQARADFVSRSTGRVLLSALFDTPPEGLTRRDCQKIITVLRQTREKLEAVCGVGTVRLTLDDFATSVFWYLVFFRPVVFDPDDPWFGGDPWSLRELVDDPKRAVKLKEMDLGVVYDPERNWLTLIWDEALKGILDGIDTCPSWRHILQDVEKRTGHPATSEWWKLCARSHSFAVPSWRVAKHGYISGTLWHRPNISYDDIVVFDLNGIDIPELNDVGEPELLTAKRARFVNFYTDDKREFQALRRKLRPREWGAKQRTAAASRAAARRKAKKEKYASWIEASSAVYDILKVMRAGYYGRRALYLEGVEVRSRFEDLARKFNQGELQIRHGDDKSWELVERHLDTIESCLDDACVPREFEMWLQWRKKGIAIDGMHAPEPEDE